MKSLFISLVWVCFASGIAGGEVSATSPMVRIEGGAYSRPLEKGGNLRTVKPYEIDVRQVTNGEFVAFVIAYPKWQRSKVNRLFADPRYLSHWESDTRLGIGAPPESPVVGVSWYAARAFLKTHGKRLPTIDEWEFVARADAEQPDANADPIFKRKILDWYSLPALDILPSVHSQESNYFGILGMHGLVWEWTLNFVSAMTSGESRSDTSPDSQLFCGASGADPSQATEYANFMRLAFRSSLQGDFCLATLGFRGARDVE